MNIKIGIDAAPLNSKITGVGYYIFHLLEELIPLHPEWHFYLYAFSSQGNVAHFAKYPHVTIRPLPFFKRCHSLWNQTTLACALYRDDIDLFLGTTQSIPIFCKKKLKNVLLLYDFIFRLFPKTVSTVKCQYQKMFTASMVRKADCILSISEGTADKLWNFYSRRSDLILHPPTTAVRYCSAEEVKIFLTPYGLQYKKYFLTVSCLVPRKNLTTLLNVYLRQLALHPTLAPLVFIGDGGWKNATILKNLHAARERYPDKIKLLGYVDEEARSHFFSGARNYLCFSLYEGYGMPLAEARLCKTPVICFDQIEMREAAENDGIFLPAENFEEQLAHYLLSEKIEEPKECRYSSNREKALKLSQTLLDLLPA